MGKHLVEEKNVKFSNMFAPVMFNIFSKYTNNILYGLESIDPKSTVSDISFMLLLVNVT